MGGTNLSNFSTRVVDVTLSVPVSTLAAGDVLADFQKVSFSSVAGQAYSRGTINDIEVIDTDDQGVEMDIVFSDKADTTPPVLGTEDDVVSISDADALTIIGIRNVSSYIDLVASQVGRPAATVPVPFNVPRNYIYVGAITRGAPVMANADGITLRLNVTLES